MAQYPVITEGAPMLSNAPSKEKSGGSQWPPTTIRGRKARRATLTSRLLGVPLMGIILVLLALNPFHGAEKAEEY